MVKPGTINWRTSLAIAVLSLASCTSQASPIVPPNSFPSRQLASDRPSAVASPSVAVLTRTRLAEARVDVVKVVDIGNPMAIAARPGDDALYVGQRDGKVWAVHDEELDHEPILDISANVSVSFDRGLLGLAFSPDGSWLYVDYIDQTTAELVVAWPFHPGRVLRNGGRTIITIPQPGLVHHGGDIAFGPDGDLWISTGDATDEDASESATVAQSLGSLLGKLLRIVPTPSGQRPYRIPSTNPFIDDPDASPEIFASGLRNPWRLSFDAATGDLWIGDVGRYREEEVDFVPAGRGAGANFGWNRLEGTLSLTGGPPPHNVYPLYGYPHTRGRCAVIGGYVYRGTDVLDLGGAYVFADYCTGAVQALVERKGKLALVRSLRVRVPGIVSFGEGPDGDLYGLSPAGIFRLEPRRS